MSQLFTTQYIFRSLVRPSVKSTESTTEIKLVTSIPGSPLPQSPSRVGIRSVGVITKYPANPIDYDSTIAVDWYDETLDGVVAGTYGDFYKGIISDSTSSIVISSNESKFIVGILAVSDGLNKLGIRSLGDIWVDHVKKNWIKWSNIGSADFTIWKDNIAGGRPLDLQGWVWTLKKLGNKVMAYGENGVSSLFPVDNTYGLRTIYAVGIKGKQAVAGDKSVHFFVDILGQLHSIGELTRKSSLFEETTYPEKLDYSEYLSAMGDITLSWDSLNNLLYICDGTLGYIYNNSTKSFGSGPVNVTGIHNQNGISYVGASEAIVTPYFEIHTDIFDFGNRKNKEIKYIEVGTDLTNILEGSIDYRLAKNESFYSTPWVAVTPSGILYLPCFGVEFKFKFRVNTLETFEIDYIKIRGKIDNYAYLDQVTAN